MIIPDLRAAYFQTRNAVLITAPNIYNLNPYLSITSPTVTPH